MGLLNESNRVVFSLETENMYSFAYQNGLISINGGSSNTHLIYDIEKGAYIRNFTSKSTYSGFTPDASHILFQPDFGNILNQSIYENSNSTI